MMNDDQILEVVQAHKEGKRIERSAAKNSGCFGYTAMMGEPDWDFKVFDYRVAPEPQMIRCDSSLSQQRAQKSADESGFKYYDDQRSGFIYGYEQCIKDFGITIAPEPRKPREFWLWRWKDMQDSWRETTTELRDCDHPREQIRVREVIE